MDANEHGGRAGRRPSRGAGKCRILLLEDHADTRYLLRMLLVRQGHSVTDAGSLRDARHAIAAPGAGFDVLIADLELPDGRAESVLQEFKARCPGAVVIVTSGHAYPHDVRAARAAGADLYLVKPFTVDTLNDAVARVSDCPPQAEPAPGGEAA